MTTTILVSMTTMSEHTQSRNVLSFGDWANRGGWRACIRYPKSFEHVEAPAALPTHMILRLMDRAS